MRKILKLQNEEENRKKKYIRSGRPAGRPHHTGGRPPGRPASANFGQHVATGYVSSSGWVLRRGLRFYLTCQCRLRKRRSEPPVL